MAIVYNLDIDAAPSVYALVLAELLERNDEVTLGPTDQEVCARALRDHAALIDAGLA